MRPPTQIGEAKTRRSGVLRAPAELPDEPDDGDGGDEAAAREEEVREDKILRVAIYELEADVEVALRRSRDS